MENASKALLISGGILICLLILSAGVYLYSQFSSQTKTYKEMMEANEIRKFNSNFDVYIGRNNISAQEIATVVNLANKYNGQVNIEIYNASNLRQIYDGPEAFVIEFIDSTFSYIDSEYNNATGKITKLVFKENS